MGPVGLDRGWEEPLCLSSEILTEFNKRPFLHTVSPLTTPLKTTIECYARRFVYLGIYLSLGKGLALMETNVILCINPKPP